MNCQFCDQAAVEHTVPPMCEKHLDLAILIGHLRQKGRDITIEAVQQLVYVCHTRSGVLALGIDDVEPMMAELEITEAGFERKKEAA